MDNRKNQVRIIAGKWRGRKIDFDTLDALRPTGDRVRTVLFDWLMVPIKNAVCLDIFAGSGALSFEALSRGAKAVTAWDSSADVINNLRNNAKRLEVDHLTLKKIHFPMDAPQFNSPTFDIVFIDPPFHQGWVEKTCDWLVQSGCLKKEALIYIEREKTQVPLELPEGWEIIKEKTAGNVRFCLVKTKS